MFSDTPLNQEHIQWLEEKLKHAANVIPPEILKTGGFGKMIKVIMGVVSDRVHYIDPKMSQEKKEKELFKAIQAGYYYGITYPLWDDVMDSHEILSTENKRIAFNIALKGLSGEPIQDSDVPDFNIAKQMKASFDGLQSLYPFNENPELYDALLILTQSQGIDGEHSLDEPITDKGLFLPLITKAAYSRITVPSLSGTQNPLRFENSYHFGLFSQLSDDIGDFVEDERNHRLTPFTYWANRPHDTNVSNPLHTYFGIIEFISRKYKGDNEVRETLLKHARYQLAKLAKAAGGTPGLKVILHRLGESGTPLEKLMITLSESGVNIPNPEFSVYKRVTDRFVTPEHLNRKPTLRDFFARYKEQVNKLAKINITANNSVQQRLIDSMNYSLDAGGKRMRPMLVLMTADLYNIDPTKVFPAARSIELLHTASLIIDDLPAQDNAKLRRGHKTNHLQFDEATAQLAAISLITEAFKGLGDLSTEFGYQKTKEVTDAIAKMSGPEGLSLGQAMDLNRDFGRSENGVKELLELNHLKTGLAIEGSISPIAKLVGATDEEIKALEAFSYHLGAVFQIRDDILDVEGDIKAMGKDTNQDASTRTFVTVLGLQGAKDKLNDMRNLGLVDLAKIKKDTSLFKEMLTYAAERNH
jgi:geranylgeranyl pyrophosphate synthase